MNKRQRLAALRSEAATLTAALVDGSATPEQVERANALPAEITALVAEEEERGSGGTEDGETQEQRAMREARERLANLPDDPTDRGPDSGGGAGDRDPGNRGGGGGYQTRTQVLERPLARVAREFTTSRAYQDFAARGLSGQAAVDIDVLPSELASRATIGSADVPTRNPYLPGILEPAYRGLTLLDMIDRQTTGLSSIPFVQETTPDPGAGATEVAEGALKPEVDVDLAEADSPVRTIAAWLNLTRQMAEDAPTVAGFIQGRLGFKVLHRLNAQIWNGNGTAPNLRGINATVGINVYAPGAAEARIISIRKAITMIQQDEYAGDTLLINPADWELVELSVDNNGAFRASPNVQSAMTRTLWGLSVVVDTIIAAGTAMVGAFRLGATLWERHGVRTIMTDSHASNFTSNILTVLAEMRAALTVWRPSVFCRITFNGTT
jgi:HK97 family phage major capsid protein